MSTAAVPFSAVEEERQRGEALVAGAQHVGGADVARADGAHVAETGGARQQETERDRAEEIAERERTWRVDIQEYVHGNAQAPRAHIRSPPAYRQIWAASSEEDRAAWCGCAKPLDPVEAIFRIRFRPLPQGVNRRSGLPATDLWLSIRRARRWGTGRPSRRQECAARAPASCSRRTACSWSASAAGPCSPPRARRDRTG